MNLPHLSKEVPSNVWMTASSLTQRTVFFSLFVWLLTVLISDVREDLRQINFAQREILQALRLNLAERGGAAHGGVDGR